VSLNFKLFSENHYCHLHELVSGPTPFIIYRH